MNGTLLICGSRHATDAATQEAIRSVLQRCEPQIVITGGARGVDTLADVVAEELGIQRIIVPANWKRHGRKAGPLRNRVMLSLSPTHVHAWMSTASRGTKDCVTAARQLGIPVTVHQL